MTTVGFTKEYLNKFTTMKMKIANLVGLMSFAIIGLAQAQDNWKWPADEQAEATARANNAAYNDYLKAEDYVNATRPLHWLLVNAPDLNESLYINGVRVYAGPQMLSPMKRKRRFIRIQ